MKAVLITGGNRGVGLSLSKQFAFDLGFKVYMASRDVLHARAAIKELGNPYIVPLQMDVGDETSIRSAFRKYCRIKEVDEVLDVIINNAGSQLDWVPGGPYKSAFEIPYEIYETNYRVNALASLFVVKHFMPAMHEGGRVVNVSSGAAELGHGSAMQDAYGAYAPSKLALIMITKKLAGALQSRGIAVNAACPGWCATRMGGSDAPRTAEYGAESIVAACFLETDAPPTGQFFRHGQRVYVDEMPANERRQAVYLTMQRLTDFARRYAGKRICIYGAGQFTDMLMNFAQGLGMDICGFVDRDKARHGQLFYGVKIHDITEIAQLKPDVILVAIPNPSEMLPWLREYRDFHDLRYDIAVDIFGGE